MKTYYFWRLDLETTFLSVGKVESSSPLEFYKLLSKWNNTAPGIWQYGETTQKIYDKLKSDH
jgi:hypothetical protein